MGEDDWPVHGAWRHHTAREAFEVAVFATTPAGGVIIEGCTTGVEDGVAWSVAYAITTDERWHTRRALVTSTSPDGRRELRLSADGAGRWTRDGVPVPALDGCLDVDLESSVVTNTLTVRRLGRDGWPGPVPVPAAYVRAPSLQVEVLDQTYARLDGRRVGYTAPAFDVRCELVYDGAGLIVDYPGLATRIA